MKDLKNATLELSSRGVIKRKYSKLEVMELMREKTLLPRQIRKPSIQGSLPSITSASETSSSLFHTDGQNEITLLPPVRIPKLNTNKISNSNSGAISITENPYDIKPLNLSNINTMNSSKVLLFQENLLKMMFISVLAELNVIPQDDK